MAQPPFEAANLAGDLGRKLPPAGQIPGITLVRFPEGRSLMSLDESMSICEFELAARDALDTNAISTRGSARCRRRSPAP